MLFEERQRFRQLWLWALIAAVFVVTLLPAGVERSGWSLALGLAVAALLYAMELRVQVDAQAITIRFFPFLRRRIRPADVVRCEARTYRPILEYGGWGVRWGPGRGMAYNVSGNRGVQLELADGKRVLIGSQRPEQLEAAIRQVWKGPVSAQKAATKA